jgi:DNA (cytosine-5)-methyltransferase 1
MLPVISLFCGAGGLDLGFERAGFSPLLALDLEPAAVDTYNRNRPQSTPARLENLAECDPAKLLSLWKRAAGHERPIGVIGGPPCQAFSAGNVRKDQSDPRRALTVRYAEALAALQDTYDLDFFVFENVLGLMKTGNQDVFREFVQICWDAGFSVREPVVLNAINFGVPQVRRRLFVVGLNRQKFGVDRFHAPKGSGKASVVRDALSGLPDPMFFARGVRPKELGLHPNHWCMNPRSRKFQDGVNGTGSGGGRSFRRLRWDTPSWTVAYGHREVHVHPSGTRRLSVFEAMRLQGFPDEYELCGTLSDQFRLVSDAVPPPVGYAIASSIRQSIEAGPVSRLAPAAR